jgi:hypothetical protein
LEKVLSEPVPGGPFLTGEAMLKSGAASTVEKSLSTNAGTDAPNYSSAAVREAELTKMLNEATSPLLKEQVGIALAELQLAEEYRKQAAG